MAEVLRKNIIIIVVAVAFVATAIIATLQSSSMAEEKAALDSQVAAVESEIQVKQLSIDNANQEVAQAATGTDVERKKRDDELARGLMKTATTWSSMDEYNTARQEIMRKYNMKPDSEFMSSYLPVVKPIKDSSGNSYNEIDQVGLNMSFVDMRSSVTRIKGTTYNYTAVATVSSQSKNQKAVATTYSLVSYEVDAEGNIGAITVQAVPGAPNTTK